MTSITKKEEYQYADCDLRGRRRRQSWAYERDQRVGGAGERICDRGDRQFPCQQGLLQSASLVRARTLLGPSALLVEFSDTRETSIVTGQSPEGVDVVSIPSSCFGPATFTQPESRG